MLIALDLWSWTFHIPDSCVGLIALFPRNNPPLRMANARVHCPDIITNASVIYLTF